MSQILLVMMGMVLVLLAQEIKKVFRAFLERKDQKIQRNQDNAIQEFIRKIDMKYSGKVINVNFGIPEEELMAA